MSKKKSAMSKGYRKTVKKDKPFLTKKEIIALVIIVAAIALAILLFNLLYDDGFMSASEIQENDIVSYAGQDNRTRYMKLGEANDFEGFDKQVSDASGAVKTFEYINQDETSPLDKFALTGSYVNGSTLVDSTLQYFQGLEGGSFTDKLETEVKGRDAYIFSYTYDYYQAPEGEAAEEPAETEEAAEEPAAEEPAAEEPAAEEPASEEPAAEELAVEEPAVEEPAAEEADTPASNVFCQNMTCYISCPDDHCIALHLYLSGEDNSFYVPDDEIEAYILQYADAVTLAEEEA